MNSVTDTPPHQTSFSSPVRLTEQNTEENIDIGQYWRIALQNKWGIISITTLCLIIGILVALSATPIYRASTTILANPSQPNANSQDQYASNALVFLFYETQYKIIHSRAVAESVVDKLDLIAEFKAKNAQKPKTNNQSKGILQTLKNWLPINFQQAQTDNAKANSIVDDNKLKIALARNIQANLQIEGGNQSQIINISYQSPNAQEATDIVNAVASAYIEFGLTSRLNEIEKTAHWLDEQLARLKTKLQESENRLQSYRQQKDMVNTSQQQNIASTQLQALNSELIRAQTRQSEAGIRYRQVKNLSSQSGSSRSLSTVLNSSTIQELAGEETRLSRKVEELSERYGEKHPKMIAARSDLNSVKNNLQRGIDKVNENTEKEYRSSITQVNNIKALIHKLKQDMGSVQGANFTLAGLEREVENNRRIYESFLSRLMDADISGRYNQSNIQIIDTATTPGGPFKPNIKLIIIISVVLGLFFGVLIAFIKELLNNTFRTSTAVEERLGIPFLGLTPAVKSAKNEALPEQQFLKNSRSPFSESINSIRTGLLFSNIDNPPQTILITSATGSEGKSTLAINLAVSLSQLDRTLLLEVDLRKPSLRRYMATQKSFGLCDLVAGQADLQHITSQVVNGNDNLHIINCGTLPPNPLELISSQGFAHVLSSLKDNYRYIVLDGPPTLPVSDATVLGHLCDATVLTVKAESTSIKVAKKALLTLQNLGVKVTGSVLSQAEPQRMNYYGDHYYTGDYYGHEEHNNQEGLPGTTSS